MSTGYQRNSRIRPILLAVFGLISQGGCCHWCYNHQPACAPAAASAPVVRYGAVCEAPAEGVVVSQGAPRSSSTSINDAPRPKVVVSEPNGRSTSGWRRSDPESLATTRVEGSIDDNTRSR